MVYLKKIGIIHYSSHMTEHRRKTKTTAETLNTIKTQALAIYEGVRVHLFALHYVLTR